MARTEVRAAGTELGEVQAGDPGGRERGASLVFFIRYSLCVQLLCSG